jgi:large subunit ribosomal protein L27
MAHRKAGGTAKNLRDSNPKYLGTKIHDGDYAKAGSIIVRQRGTKILAGNNVRIGRDHTLYADKVGMVKFGETRKTNFDGINLRRKIVHVIPVQKKA